MIIATAGHVDHGKTALIRALTGQETDRSAEEQARGMSINLGFAYLDTPCGSALDFVDVPGHEKFMRTLLAGMGCVEAALLLVAADDGLMPQTLEHIELLSLLRLHPIILVLTKTDRVDPARLAQVQEDACAALQQAGLQAAACFSVNNLDGQGIPALRAHLLELARNRPLVDSSGSPRFHIDRHFSRAGTGQIVTGTLVSGQITAGDQLCLSVDGSLVRVRALHIHGQPVERALAGQRCALQIATQAPAQALQRGSQLLTADIRMPSRRFDSHLDLHRPMPTRGSLQLHLANSTVNARCVVLGERDSSPYWQWITDEPLCLRQGDRFIIRDPASRQFIGSARVVDPFAPERGRQRPERLAGLKAMDQTSPAEALSTLLQCLVQGVDLQRFALTWQLRADQLETLIIQVAQQGSLFRRGQWLILHARLQDQIHTLLALLQDYHQRHPERLGPGKVELAGELGLPLHSPLLHWTLRLAQDQKQLQQSGPALFLSSHQPKTDPQLQRLLSDLQPPFMACSPRPPDMGELMSRLSIEREALLAHMEQLCRQGSVVFIGRNRYLLPEATQDLYGVLRQCAEQDAQGHILTPLFRDRSGIGRNHSVAVLEYFDRVGVTRFRQGVRRLAEPWPPSTHTADHSQT